MWEQLRRFSALHRDARRMFVRAVFLLPMIALSLRIRGFRFTQSALGSFVSAPRFPLKGETTGRLASAVIKDQKHMTARMVRAAARYGVKTTTCLEESLALWFLLQREGMAADLRIGARKTAGKFEAHAWVECDGQALNDVESVHHHYAVFDAGFAPAAETR